MADIADLLMLSGVLHLCPDCVAESMFVPIEADGEYCCTNCGAALLIDPMLRDQVERAIAHVA